MHEHGIRADYCQTKCKRSQKRQTDETENLLKRQFKQQAANQVWGTDITELAYRIGFNKVHLHVVLDLYS